MNSRKSALVLSVIFMVGLFIAGFSPAAEAKYSKSKKKAGIFTRMGKAIKKTCKKVKRGVVKAGCSVTNTVMDSAVNAKAALTGKKKSTWVKGHYKKGSKQHTNGHFRKVSRKSKKGGSNPGQDAGMSGQGDFGQGDAGQGDMGQGGGEPAPEAPADPSVPSAQMDGQF
ncbi:MAG: hypothetical protein HQM10_11780 [Candidatus Riflebacteria bacterium]|nr:hypothetical protein [Candidatus Riflebacteria bacterium]